MRRRTFDHQRTHPSRSHLAPHAHPFFFYSRTRRSQITAPLLFLSACTRLLPTSATHASAACAAFSHVPLLCKACIAVRQIMDGRWGGARGGGGHGVGDGPLRPGVGRRFGPRPSRRAAWEASLVQHHLTPAAAAAITRRGRHHPPRSIPSMKSPSIGRCGSMVIPVLPVLDSTAGEQPSSASKGQRPAPPCGGLPPPAQLAVVPSAVRFICSLGAAAR